MADGTSQSDDVTPSATMADGAKRRLTLTRMAALVVLVVLYIINNSKYRNLLVFKLKKRHFFVVFAIFKIHTIYKEAKNTPHIV